MLCKELTEKIEEVYPVSYACEWDNVGLLVGRANKEVKSVYLALDVTEEVIQEAVRVKADLLITHHPLILRVKENFRSGFYWKSCCTIAAARYFLLCDAYEL